MSKTNKKYIFIIIILLITILTGTVIYSESSFFWKVPEELAGSFNSDQDFTIRHSDGFMKYKFVKSVLPVHLHIEINKDGKVYGSIGEAQLKGVLMKNRGWLFRFLNLAVDYRIEGKLLGSIFKGDAGKERSIKAPFNFKNGRTDGSLFEMVDFDLYPMSSLSLKKD